MEKDQNTNTDNQNNESEEIKAEDLDNNSQPDFSKITKKQKRLLLRKNFRIRRQSG